MNKMGKVVDPDFMLSPGATYTADHTILACNRWEAHRRSLVLDIGGFKPKSLVKTMLRVVNIWNWVAHFIEAVLKSKMVNIDRALIKISYVVKPHGLTSKGIPLILS